MAFRRPRPLLRFSAAILVAIVACARFGYADPPAISADSPAAGEAKPWRPKIYDERANGKELISAALKRARLEGKHVLIEWGGNWCGCCHKLHDMFVRHELVCLFVAYEFELVLVESTYNRELLEAYGGKETRHSFPHLTVLDAQGKVLTHQETGSLEIGPQYDPKAVAAFLNKWQPKPPNAEDLLAAALQKSTRENKRILLHVGSPDCRWCSVLTQFLADHESLLSRDYVELKVDSMRMRQGQEVAARFLPANCSGVPWMAIIDASGKVLATSVGPDGNCSYPLRPRDIDHFLSMLECTKQRLTDDALQQIRTDLNSYRVANQQRLAAASPPLAAEVDVAVERDDIGLDVLLDAYRARESRIPRLEVRWEEVVVQRMGNGKYDKFARKWRVLLEGDKVRTEEFGAPDASTRGIGGKVVRFIAAFDGKVGKRLGDPGGGRNAHGIVDDKDGSQMLRVNNANLDPILFALRPTVVLASRQMFRTPWTAKFGALDGQRVFVLRRKAGSGQMRDEELYIDPSNFLIKRAISGNQSTVLQWDIEYRDADGFALPVAWKRSTSDQNGRLYHARTARAVQVSISPEIAPSEFDLDFPVGTIVNDLRTKETYTIGPTGAKKAFRAEDAERAK